MVRSFLTTIQIHTRGRDRDGFPCSSVPRSRDRRRAPAPGPNGDRSQGCVPRTTRRNHTAAQLQFRRARCTRSRPRLRFLRTLAAMSVKPSVESGNIPSDVGGLTGRARDEALYQQAYGESIYDRDANAFFEVRFLKCRRCTSLQHGEMTLHYRRDVPCDSRRWPERSLRALPPVALVGGHAGEPHPHLVGAG